MLEIDIYGNDIDEILKKLKLISKRKNNLLALILMVIC